MGERPFKVKIIHGGIVCLDLQSKYDQLHFYEMKTNLYKLKKNKLLHGIYSV